MPIIRHARWRELEPLLDQALELTAEEREPWLEHLRSQSPDLADDLTSLLSGESIADRDGFLAGGVHATLEGTEIGAYRLIRQLGQGGMGTVWLAQRSDGRFDGNTAVKLLNLSLLTTSGQERFRREGSTLARLAHPGIARLMDAGISNVGQPYLVLEYVDGERIDRFADAHKLGRDARIRLVLKVLSAVAHAHASLVVHRDIKPSNILVDATGNTKLLDFGIAKLLASETISVDEQLTADGARAMTPEFAAPEQARGEPVTTATDVYACAVLLYLLLSAKHPTAEGCRTAEQTMTALFSVEPKALHMGDLDIVLSKALQKDASLRYQTAGAFADDLERFLRHEAVSAQRTSTWYRARRFMRRNRTPVIAAAASIVALIVATGVSIDRMREARRQSERAQFQKERADAQLEFQNLLLSGMGPGQLTMKDMLDQGQALLREEYAGSPGVAASIALSLGGFYDMIGEYDSQAAMIARAESLAVLAGAQEPNVRLLSRCARAMNLSDRQRDREALALVDSIRPMLHTASADDAATCLSAAAEVSIRSGRFDSAAVMSHEASALLEQTKRTSSMHYIGVLNTEANALENVKRRRDALAIYERIAAVLDSSGRGRTATRNVIRNNIGIALSNLGEITAAEPILRQTVATFLGGKSEGFVHPAILVNYCRTLLAAGKLDSAQRWYARLYEQSAEHGDALMETEGAMGLARVHLARAAAPASRQWINRARQAHARQQTPDSGSILELEASFHAIEGRLPLAVRQFGESLHSMGYAKGTRSYQMRAVLVAASESALDAGNAAMALEYSRAARDIAYSDELSNSRSAYVGEARALESRALLATGDTAGAIAALRSALIALRYGVGNAHFRTREAESLLATISR